MTQTKKRAVVLLAPGFETIEAMTPVDVLRRAGAAVSLVGLSDLRVRSAQGVVVEADFKLAELDAVPDLVVVPGGLPGADHLGESEAVRVLVLAVQAAGGVIGAICAAPVRVLGPFGLLEGRRATCYPGMEGEFPEGAYFTDERVVRDGHLITGRGPGTALSFSLALVEALLGEPTAQTVARQLCTSFTSP